MGRFDRGMREVSLRSETPAVGTLSMSHPYGPLFYAARPTSNPHPTHTAPGSPRCAGSPVA